MLLSRLCNGVAGGRDRGAAAVEGDLQVWHVLLGAGPVEVEDGRFRMSERVRVGRVDRRGRRGDVRAQFLMYHVWHSLQRVRPRRAGTPVVQGGSIGRWRFSRRGGDRGRREQRLRWQPLVQQQAAPFRTTAVVPVEVGKVILGTGYRQHVCTTAGVLRAVTLRELGPIAGQMQRALVVLLVMVPDRVVQGVLLMTRNRALDTPALMLLHAAYRHIHRLRVVSQKPSVGIIHRLRDLRGIMRLRLGSVRMKRRRELGIGVIGICTNVVLGLVGSGSCGGINGPATLTAGAEPVGELRLG